MTHAEFVEAYAAGRVTVEISPREAARFLSARLLLPFVLLPVLGFGVALALVGWIGTGLSVIALAIATRWLVKRSAAHFVLTQSLADPRLYHAATEQNILRVTTRESREKSRPLPESE